MSKPRLVLIGNGMAGVRTVEELLKVAGSLRHHDLRCRAPPELQLHPCSRRKRAGEMTIREIVLNELGGYKEKGIRLHTGKEHRQD